MAIIRVGSRVGGTLTWNGGEGEGEPLYVDSVRQLLWAWLPNAAAGDRVALDIEGTVIELSAFDGGTRGILAIPIPAEQQRQIESIAPDELYAAPLFSLTETDT